MNIGIVLLPFGLVRMTHMHHHHNQMSSSSVHDDEEDNLEIEEPLSGSI